VRSPAILSAEPRAPQVSTCARLPAFTRVAAVFFAAVLLDAAWAAVIPPLEGPDETYSYGEALRHARGEPIVGSSLLPVMSGPIMAAFGPAPPFEPRRNPSFRFVSNEHGDVNRYMHGRLAWMPAAHARRILALRAITIVLCAGAVAAIYVAAFLFFGRADLALLVAALVAATPQFSFMSAVLNTEGASTFAGAAIAAVFAAKAMNVIGPGQMWLLLVPVFAMAPFSDRQAYPLLPMLPLGLLIVARRRAWRVALVVALAVAAIIVYRYAPEYLHDRVPPLIPWLDAMQHPIRPFFSRPDIVPYYICEILPKLFEGFWGWLGQPSILLPAWMYGAAGAWLVIAAIGLTLLPFSPNARTLEMTRAMAVFGVATVLVATAVVYAPVVLGPNLYYGRWMFPVIGPLFTFGVLGVVTLCRVLRTRPRMVANAFTALAVAIAAVYVSPFGRWLRAGIRAHHYGDQARLLDAIELSAGLTIAVSLLVAAVASGRLRAPRPRFALQPIPAIVATIVAVNLALLVGYLRPLYAAMSEEDFHRAVGRATAAREFVRATDVAAVGVEAFPASATLRADWEQSAFRTGPYEPLRAYVDERFRGSPPLDTAGDVFQAARIVRITGWPLSDSTRGALERAAARPDLAGARALLEAELTRSTMDPTLAARVLAGPRSVRVGSVLRDVVTVDGYALEPAAGRCELTLFFRPGSAFDTMRMWMRVDAPSIPEYIEFEPDPPAFGHWIPGELAWESFQLPLDTGHFIVGLTLGSQVGPVADLGRIADCAPTR
jgi:hypothetical protein